VLAQLGNPDMRTPIAYALGYPERIDSGVGSLDLFKIAHLDFEAPDTGRFPCLRLAFEALRLGGTAPAILNAANEIAVAAFLARKLRFVDIPRLIEAILEHMPVVAVDSLAGVSEADDAARRLAREWLDRRA
jgi:1-deoxy-D-xylulose-5-phosphate reductoisomerase